MGGPLGYDEYYKYYNDHRNDDDLVCGHYGKIYFINSDPRKTLRSRLYYSHGRHG